ncbi:MAG: HEPN domain-containing protein [Candidatus Poribacteria bacterium]|nr:HEPN domain-containing protein [Candidatus Poribacteria bacterium]
MTDDEINRAIEEAENARDSFQYIRLLDGIVLQDEVEIYPGIRLVPFPQSLGKRGEKIPRYVSKWASTVGIDYFFHKTRLTIDPSEAPEFNSEQFCKALSLTCNFAVQVATTIPVKKDEEPFSLVPYAGPLVTHPPRDATKDFDIVEAKCLYERLENLDSNVRQKLHIPINRWIKSHAEQSAMFDRVIDPEISPKDIPGSPKTRTVDKMIDLGIAFESLYLSGPKNLSRKFRRRASWFLKKDEAHRQTLKEKFEKIYDLRCDAVHEGKLPRDVEVCGKSVPISAFIEQAQGLCQQSILKIIKNGQFPDWAKIHIPDC